MSTPIPSILDAADREFDHPLRAIPWIRKFPDKLWVALLLTAILSTVCAVAFGVVGGLMSPNAEFGRHLRESFVYSFASGYSIHLVSRIFVPTIRIRLRNRPFFVRLVADIAVWVGGGMMGFGIAGTILGRTFGQPNIVTFAVLAGTVLMSITTGVALRQQAVKEITAVREKAERSEAQRTLALSRLRLLQAQIEPHFLFNTLANVSSLIESDPKQARKMLDQFTLLLRASLDQTRKETTSLRAEVQVVDAYLSVLKVRMGERLSYTVQAAPELLNIQVPAMLLQPIVENAVKHGIEPRVKGGNVNIEVHRDGEQLLFAVADDGVGFVPNSQENVGLGAVRERLAVQFGDAAAIRIERTPDNWTRVEIRIPIPA
jgi:two-component sensor histidine kinase